MPLRTLLAAALLLGALTALSGCGGGTPTRIMLVGDSITQGSAGDWTWRYRLWQHLRDSGAQVDLVGPWDDLYDYNAGVFGSHAYADPHFDQDHAARWGTAFTDEQPPIGTLVRRYHPDVVVEGFGVNDLVWRHETPQDTLAAARSFVEQARATAPDVDVVLTALPQRWLAGVDEYDAGLTRLAPELSTSESPVVVALPAQPFVQDVDTWDAAHPSATGEVKIAAGVADALAALGIGTPYPRPLPEVPLGPRRPAVLSAVAGPAAGEVDLSWQLPPGGTAVFVWLRHVTTREDWVRLPIPQPGTSFTASGLVAGDRYEFRVQAEKGTAVASDVFSDVVTATPGPPSG